jgi:glycosyltransferase involved in cell wall biosynthesis
MLVSALGEMGDKIKEKLVLTVVGDGPEKNNLEQQAAHLHLQKQVRFTGWVDHQKTMEYYRSADLFCFPSVREFGGAVVLEAMAAGLPCIVVNHGGISEYVTGETGIKIDPVSKAFIIRGLIESVKRLVNDPELHGKLSENAILRAGEFEWGRKAKQLVEIYREALT